MNNEAGFTLIEVLVAIGITAVALVAMVGRMGASADIQYGLSNHALMQDTAMNLLQQQRFSKEVKTSEESGTIEIGDNLFRWRLWVEQTELDGFVRQNVAVSHDDEPDFLLFLYREQSTP